MLQSKHVRNLIEAPTRESQNWTVLSHPPVMKTFRSLGWNTLANTRLLCPSTRSKLPLQNVHTASLIHCDSSSVHATTWCFVGPQLCTTVHVFLLYYPPVCGHSCRYAGIQLHNCIIAPESNVKSPSPSFIEKKEIFPRDE